MLKLTGIGRWIVVAVLVEVSGFVYFSATKLLSREEPYRLVVDSLRPELSSLRWRALRGAWRRSLL